MFGPGQSSGWRFGFRTADVLQQNSSQENLLQEGDCVATKSVATKSVATKGAVAKSAAVKSVVAKSVVAKSVAAKSAVAKSAVAKSVGGKAAVVKTAAPKSPAKKGKELMTDQDLLDAPEKDYMNEAQLAFFKQRLLELRTQLLTNADDTGQHLRENEVTTDPSDRATLEEEYTLELRTRDRERKLLKKVEKSLKMIDDGSYGYCEETGEPIGVPRLLARPTATLSLEAQERRERVQKLYGD
jgi:DnaK suppressor protein